MLISINEETNDVNLIIMNMKTRAWGFTIALLLTGCAVIPKETVPLSKAIGNDLQVLHTAHRNIIQIYFNKIIRDINSFVDDVYAPYVIHYVLKADMKDYKSSKPSLFGSVEAAASKQGKTEADSALIYMSDFLNEARAQIEDKRTELLFPIQKQASDLLLSVDQSYENVIHANRTLTAYLESLQKVKAAQQVALGKVGLNKADSVITNSLVKLSDQVEKAVQLGRKIDIQSIDAKTKLDEVSNRIKGLMNNK
jgi:hypothetical protein